ncbi:MAG: NfeD family protein [Alphaproteobacteria bacterium]|nr:NfeD family protein [Alphaproteobacteria bacterium]
MDQLFPFMGPYFWWSVAGILLLAELAMPGFFMLWLAAAAALTALLDLYFAFSWAGEILTFAALSFVLVLATWRMVMGSRHMKSDQPHLNQRHQGLVGRSFVLDSAITNGSGKIKSEDTLWDVDGPDLPVGARVKVTGVNGMRLVVEAA